MLRKFLLVIPFILLLVVGTTYAQSSESEGILFQAVAKDFQGNVAGERSINVRLELLKNAANGAIEYQEKLEVISDVNGIFSVVIGRGEQIGGLFSFSELDWSVTSYFLHVEIAISPTIFSPEWDLEKEYKDLGTTKLWSVPYALSSKSAELATTLETVLTPDLGGTGLDNGENRLKLEGNLSVIGSGDVNFYVDAGSSITLPLNGTIATLKGEESLLNKTLTNPVITSPEFIGVIEVPYPSGQNENEAVNSKYLNEELSKINSEVSQNTTEISSNNSSIEENQDAISSNTTLINTLESSKLSLLGGTMTGAIDMGANSISNLPTPTDDSDAANKSYVDLSLSEFSISLPETKLSIAGGTMTGAIDMGSNSISNLQTPTDNSDAANKSYVDNAVENVDITKLELTLAQNQIFVGNSSEKALAVDLNGDASLTSTGTLTINNNVVTAVKIADANVTEAKLADDAVTAVKILDANVTTTKIADANVTEAKLAVDAVTTVKILDANVTTTKIADANVTEAKLAVDAVTTVKILDANVTTAKIADANVTEAKLAVDAVITVKILDANVTTAKIADANVTEAKLAVDAVTTVKILDANVTNAKLAKGIDAEKLADGSVDNSELQYIGNLTSDAQTQLDAKLALAGGTMTGAIDMGSNSISNLQTPTDNSDAANKSYVDNAVAGAAITPQNLVALALKADLNSPELTGVPLAPTAALATNTDQIATTKYVDTAVAGITGGEGGTAAIQAELDLTQTGVGLGTDGSYSANLDMEYISGATSVVDATELLDTQVKTNAAAIEINTAKASMVLGTSSTTALAGDTSLLQLGTTTTTALAGDTDGVEYIGSLTSNAQTQLDAKLALAGGTMTGAINMGTKNISNSGSVTAITFSGDLNGTINTATTATLQLPADNSNKIATTEFVTAAVGVAASASVDGITTNAAAIDDLEELADGKIYLGNGSNVATEKTMSGAVTIDNAGVTTIGAGKVTTTEILDGTIVVGDLADNAVETIKIKDLNVTNAKLDKTNIPLSGFGAATDDVALGANKLTGVSDPTAAQDAATKAYVDSKELLLIQSFTATGIIDPQTQLAVIAPTSDITITLPLPDAAGAGAQLRLKRNNDTTYTITISGNIDGVDSRTMNTAYQSYYLVSTGIAWLLIN